MRDSSETIVLLASVIYVPGTGGSFLTRCLCLSPGTVTGDSGASGRDYEISLTVDEKLQRLNQWNARDWKSAESLTQPGYRCAEIDFYLYEQSPLYLIDAWHPREFLEHDQNSMAWDTGAWPWIVEIGVTSQHRPWLEANQNRKNYQLSWDQELDALENLREIYTQRWVSIDFDHLLTWDTFRPGIENIAQKLELDLDVSAVQRLWQEWIVRSQQIWQR